jgi:hypothetical protein
MNKSKPGLGQWHYEEQLLANLRASLNDHMLRYHPYLDAPSRGIILKFYDRQVDKKDIIKLYSHPCEDFLQALVNNRLGTLLNKSSARLTRNPTPKTT